MDKKYKWFVVIFFFTFLSFHEADRFIISAVAPDVEKEFQVSHAQLGLVFSLTVLSWPQSSTPYGGISTTDTPGGF
ncbi:MAG: hypothetical protein ABWK01_06630 [Infirmifilum sp.]